MRAMIDTTAVIERTIALGARARGVLEAVAGLFGPLCIGHDLGRNAGAEGRGMGSGRKWGREDAGRII